LLACQSKFRSAPEHQLERKFRSAPEHLLERKFRSAPEHLLERKNSPPRGEDSLLF